MNKRLLFSKELVPLVLTGKKNSIWRLWDDKNLQPGDIVDFYESNTKRYFATAKITKVIEKKMGDFTEEDKRGHEEFSTNEEMYRTYSGYYKKDVTPDTLVKICWFEIT